jgi:hypothetical protein
VLQFPSRQLEVLKVRERITMQAGDGATSEYVLPAALCVPLSVS